MSKATPVVTKRHGRKWFAGRIRQAWQKTLDGIFEVGRLVGEAKDSLPHGEFLDMIKEDLPFKKRTAQLLMVVANDPKLSKAQHAALLPPSWMTLYEITRLDDDVFEQAVADGDIHPEVTRSTILKLLQPILPAPTFDVSPDRYGIVMCDPPWRYEHVKTTSRAIENQYPTMSLEEICDMPIDKKIDANAIMFMWATSPKLHESFDVLEAWGLNYRTCAIWDKEKIGMGYYFRQQHELLLVATRGKAAAPIAGTQPSSVFSSPRGKHSEKPVEVYEAIEKMYPNHRKLEMFARSSRKDWESWGNQSPS